jgi:hypothetical protein
MVEADAITLDARIQISADHLSGELRLADGRAIPFEGWLGLIGAVELACSSATPPTGTYEAP